MKLFEIEKEFCNEEFNVSAEVYATHTYVYFICAGDKHGLRVTNAGEFIFDHTLATMWDYEVDNFLVKSFYELMNFAGTLKRANRW